MISVLPENALEQTRNFFLQLAETISSGLENQDGKARFIEDIWQREEEGGGGITRVMQKGDLIAKAGVNFSHVSGAHLPPSATVRRPELAGCQFQAMGVSLVVHSDNPYVPTTHANVRFFMAEKPGHAPIWWFGGGFDLTPFYGFPEDCRHWHQTAEAACKPFGEHVYSQFKKNCDEYFYLKHRDETRGVGGLFFDDYNENSFEHSFALTRSIGEHFLDAWQPIAEKRRGMAYTQKEKDFQLYRRGRYAEFNLVYDRGTLFGLQSGGRTESILMSLPPEVHWSYDWQPPKDSIEGKFAETFLVPRDWLNI